MYERGEGGGEEKKKKEKDTLFLLDCSHGKEKKTRQTSRRGTERKREGGKEGEKKGVRFLYLFNGCKKKTKGGEKKRNAGVYPWLSRAGKKGGRNDPSIDFGTVPEEYKGKREGRCARVYCVYVEKGRRGERC